MATSTLALDCPNNAWTLLVDGATYKICGVQSGSLLPLAIAVATSTPAGNSDAYVVLSGGARDNSVIIELAATDKVYGRGLGGDSKARFYRTTIA